MKLHQYLKFMVCFTLLALVYIHLQMQIVELAYMGKEKEKLIRHMNEENSDITYKILSLKSAHHLGIQMLQEDSEMNFVDPNNVIQVSHSTSIEDGLIVELSDAEQKPKNALLGLLSFGSSAQAKTLK